jgi:hypothetical protein
MNRFACPACGAALQHPTPGHKAACPGCGQRVEVPRAPTNRTVLGVMPAAGPTACRPDAPLVAEVAEIPDAVRPSGRAWGRAVVLLFLFVLLAAGMVAGMLALLRQRARGTSQAAAAAGGQQPPNGEAAAAAKHEQALRVTAEDMIVAWLSNRVNAEHLYVGKILEASGQVSSVGRDPDGAPLVSLNSDEPGKVAERLKRWTIYQSIPCLFSPDAERAVAALKRVDRVTIRGRCFVHQQPFLGASWDNIALRDCTLVEQAPTKTKPDAIKGAAPE